MNAIIAANYKKQMLVIRFMLFSMVFFAVALWFFLNPGNRVRKKEEAFASSFLL